MAVAIDDDAEAVESAEPYINVVDTAAGTAAAEEQPETVAENAPLATPGVTEPAPEPQAPKAAEPEYDTVTKSRFLTTMARDHYGKKNYWIFIYNANPQLGDPNRIAPGTRILIPAKESFAGATEKETDAKAQALLNELSRKYKL